VYTTSCLWQPQPIDTKDSTSSVTKSVRGVHMLFAQLHMARARAHLSSSAAAASVTARLTPPVMMDAAMGDDSPADANTCTTNGIHCSLKWTPSWCNITAPATLK
jgi:hypothetical protein